MTHPFLQGAQIHPGPQGHSGVGVPQGIHRNLRIPLLSPDHLGEGFRGGIRVHRFQAVLLLPAARLASWKDKHSQEIFLLLPGALCLEKFDAGWLHIDPPGFVVFGDPGFFGQRAYRLLDVEDTVVPVDRTPLQPAHLFVA